MSNLLQVQELHVAFGPKTVVEGVSLSIAPGEKLEHTFLALNHLAAAIITLRKISLPVNIIYG